MFSAEQIKELQTEYATIDAINPDTLAYRLTLETLDNMDDETLAQVRDAEIKWLSPLALNRCIRRGLNCAS